MEVDDNIAEENGQVIRESKYCDFHLWPVPAEGSGQGLPYAPPDWPRPGDTWGWRVGRRVTLTGHHLDRYLYLPKRLCRLEFGASCKKFGFKSKLSVERYIRTTFPSADVAAFFSSFSWRVPANLELSTLYYKKGNDLTLTHLPEPIQEKSDQSVCDSLSDGEACRAANRKCNTLLQNAENPSVAPLPCDLCCMEPLFCHACCCILCYKSMDLSYNRYSYIKCDAVLSDGYVCGHISHLHCALRSYMAGTVGGAISLDAEYLCRRCDARTDLVPHVRRLLQTCESVQCREEIEKILNFGICLLRGSGKGDATELLNRIEIAIIKLKCETPLEDIWKVDSGDESAICSGVSSDNDEMEYSYHERLLGFQAGVTSVLSISSEYQSEYPKLVDEIYVVLQALRKSQELEYKIAEAKLHGQKNYLRVLFQQLDKETCELASCKVQGSEADSLNAMLDRTEQIKREVNKLKEMKVVAAGFGRTRKSILREHFELEMEG